MFDNAKFFEIYILGFLLRAFIVLIELTTKHVWLTTARKETYFNAYHMSF